MGDVVAVVPELAPVPMPEKPSGAADARSLGARALLSVSLLVGALVLAIGLILGMVGLNVVVWQVAGRVQFQIVLATLAIVAAFGRATVAMIRRPEAPPDEVEVPRDTEPDLHAAIDELAAAVGTSPPDRIVVTPDVNAYVHEFGPLLGLAPGTRTLGIGVPLLDTLTVQQLRAVLAHEMGHLASGDTKLGPVLFRTEQVLVQLVRSLQGRWVANLFVRYWEFQHRVSAGVRRGQELVADTAAVRISGKQATADALHRVDVVGAAEEILRHAYILPMLQAGLRPADLATGRRSLLSSPERIEQLLAASQEGPETTDPWATHPPTDVRIERVAAVEATAPTDVPDERPARALFREPDRWVRAAEDRWFSLVTGDASMRVAGWEELADVVVVPEMQARADVVDRALAQIQLPAGLTGIRVALANDRERDLAAALVNQGWRVEAPNARQVILEAALTASTVRAALESGRASFATSWSGPVALLDSSGAPVDVQAAAGAALEGDWTRLDAIAPAPPTDEPTRRVDPSPGASHPSEEPFTALGAPFEPVDGPSSTYAVALPGRIGGKTRIEVAPSGIVLQGTTVAWDALDSATIDLKAPSDSGGSLTISLEDVSGRKVRAKASAATVKGTEPIVAVASYLWDLLRVLPGPRLRGAVVERVRAGEDVEVGGVIVNTVGVALAKKPAQVVPWAAVADVVVVERRVAVRATDRDGIVTTLGSPNAFLLPDLVPELRVLFG